MSRGRRTRRGLIGLALASTLSSTLIGPANAVVGGAIPAPTPPWNAKIVFSGNSLCSGALIAEQWVLTAAHCVHKNDTGALLPASTFTVYVGKVSSTDTHGFVSKVDQAPVSQAIGYTSSTGYLNDLALLHLATPAPSSLSPLPLRPSAAIVPNGSQVNFVGWGANGRTSGTGLFTTQQGDWTLQDSCYGNGQVCYLRSAAATSYPAAGDSGAPVINLTHGSAVDAGVFTGPGPQKKSIPTQYGASVMLYLSWIRSHTGLPSVGANTIVRDQATGNSWYVGGDGFREAIATGDVYNCLLNAGAALLNTSRFNALSVPFDATTNASCTPPPPPPPTTYSEQEGSHGVNTFTNYHNASGLGPRIDPYATVQVSCKVYDPFIQSVNPDGYWYRIASSPWNNAYYAPANTFYNGDPIGGPYTHNTDFAVPDC